jgi:hypothetical protein
MNIRELKIILSGEKDTVTAIGEINNFQFVSNQELIAHEINHLNILNYFGFSISPYSVEAEVIIACVQFQYDKKFKKYIDNLTIGSNNKEKLQNFTKDKPISESEKILFSLLIKYIDSQQKFDLDLDI